MDQAADILFFTVPITMPIVIMLLIVIVVLLIKINNKLDK